MSDNLNALAQKTALRAEMRQRLRAMTPEDRQSLSEEICERVLENDQWQEAQSVILFTPPSEPIITPLKLDCEARKVAWVAIAQSSRNAAELHLPDAIDLIPKIDIDSAAAAVFSIDCSPAAPPKHSNSEFVFHFNFSIRFRPSLTTL